MLNQCQLGMEHFWQDCSMCLVLSSESDCSKHEIANSAADVVQLICDTKVRNNLYFNPNLSHEGVQGKTDVHGLVMVLVCGTLHQQDKCVGIFEQLFGLIRDPSACNNWKIKYTNLNLKGTSTITDLPTLAEGSLLRSITSASSPSHSAWGDYWYKLLYIEHCLVEIKYFSFLLGGVAKWYPALNSCCVLNNIQMSTAFDLCLQHSAQVPSFTNKVASDCDVGLHSPLCPSVWCEGYGVNFISFPVNFCFLVLCQFSSTQVPQLQRLIQGPSFIWQI